MNQDEARRRLGALGVDLTADVEIEAREDRALVRLPGHRFAFLAENERGMRRLARERTVLGALQGRLSFAVPRVLAVAQDGRDEVRLGVPGEVLTPAELFVGLADRPQRSATLGAAIGRLVAELHAAVDPAALAHVLPARVSWPEPTPWIVERLPDVVADPALRRDIEAALVIFDAFVVPPGDRVFVHSDVGLHNLGLDRETWAIHGIFDFDGAAIDDRHWDFRHLCWAPDDLATLARAMDAYAGATGANLDRDRILLYNAATAFTYLAYRRGVDPDVRWCGRTLAEDLEWTRWALDNLERSAT